jgi:hypothetical protein
MRHHRIVGPLPPKSNVQPLRYDGRLPDFRTPEEEAEYWRQEHERQKRLKDKEKKPKRPTYNHEWNDRDWKQGYKPPTKALRRRLREAGLNPDAYLTSRGAVRALKREERRRRGLHSA